MGSRAPLVELRGVVVDPSNDLWGRVTCTTRAGTAIMTSTDGPGEQDDYPVPS
jgi:hypothetical protein